MNKKTTARQSLYGISKDVDTDSNTEEKCHGHSPEGRMHKLLHNATIIPMKRRSKKIQITIPPISADHKQIAVGHPEIGHILVTLETRAKLRRHCTFTADVQAICALASIILMIIAEEIIFHLDPAQPRSNEPTATIIFKSIIVFLSIIQLILALFYWKFSFTLINIDNNQPQSWHFVLSKSRVLFILFELLIIVVLPYPCVNRYTLNSNETHGASAYVTPDVALSLPMFLRLYFVYRSLVLHTQAMKNVGTGPIGYMNNIHFSFPFVTRIVFKDYPFRTVSELWIMAFFIGSWSYRACEFHKDTGYLTYSSACWLYCVTFTTVGYGDIYPNTDGGRIVSSLVGLWGIVSVAFVIAITQQYLQMTGSEDYVFEYNLRLEINKKRKYYIGNLIKFAVKVWYLRLKNNDKGQEYRRAQRKIYQAIQKIRALRRQQLRELVDDEGTDQSNEQQLNTQMIKEIQTRLDQIDAKLDRFSQLDAKLDRLTQLIDQQGVLPIIKSL